MPPTSINGLKITSGNNCPCIHSFQTEKFIFNNSFSDSLFNFDSEQDTYEEFNPPSNDGSPQQQVSSIVLPQFQLDLDDFRNAAMKGNFDTLKSFINSGVRLSQSWGKSNWFGDV